MKYNRCSQAIKTAADLILSARAADIPQKSADKGVARCGITSKLSTAVFARLVARQVKAWTTFVLILFFSSFLQAQNSLPLKVGSATVTKDSVFIDGLFPITMNTINYHVHQYDEALKCHYWGFGNKPGNNTPCGPVFNEEFQLWVISSTQFYWVYTDACNKFMLWGGDGEAIPSQFRSTLQLPTSYDFPSQ